MQSQLAAGGSERNITDAAKIVGCRQALQDPENVRIDSIFMARVSIQWVCVH